jgi:hypothetical protein
MIYWGKNNLMEHHIFETPCDNIIVDTKKSRQGACASDKREEHAHNFTCLVIFYLSFMCISACPS